MGKETLRKFGVPQISTHNDDIRCSDCGLQAALHIGYECPKDKIQRRDRGIDLFIRDVDRDQHLEFAIACKKQNTNVTEAIRAYIKAVSDGRINVIAG